MDNTIHTSRYLREVEKLDINICTLGHKDQLLCDEVEEKRKYGPIMEYDNFITKEKKNKNLFQENISKKEEKTIIMNDPLKRGQYPVSITSSPTRQFSGTIGLLYFNDDRKQLSWTFNDVKELIKKYTKQRNSDKKFDLCIGLSNIETLYYTCKDDYIEEPIIRVYGEIVSRHEDISDDSILNTLFELFTYLKVDLKQHSVRFNYQGFTEHKTYRICQKILKVNEYICGSCHKVVGYNKLSAYHNDEWICENCI